MMLAPDQLICGVAPQLLKLASRQVRQYGSFSTKSLCMTIGATEREIKPVIECLIAGGYIEKIDDDEFKMLELFSRMALATISNGISRAEAEELLAGILKRAKNINAGKYVCAERITKIAVFGSYLDPARERLGDLDIAYKSVHVEVRSDAKRIGKARSILAAGNKMISIHRFYEVENGQWPHQILLDTAAIA